MAWGYWIAGYCLGAVLFWVCLLRWSCEDLG